jgi:hypothetical protein
MIALTVEKKYGPATLRARVSAPSIGRALELCGDNARVLSPLERERLFASESAARSVELPLAGKPGEAAA